MSGGENGEEDFGDDGEGGHRDLVAGPDRRETLVEIGIPRDHHAVRGRKVADALGHGGRGG